ncbi:VTT domain-containing protein [Candidatus Micrarchaeota archaeon]|nr:VTT domain-containing protein [Candidatus Micrarchaeota archaeon]
MLKRFKGLIQISLATILCITAFFLSPWIADNFAPMGYLGVFFFSVVASATIFLPVPSWILVFSLAGTLNPLLLGICAGVGSGIGELSGYLAGRGGNYIIGADKSTIFNKHKEWIKKADIPVLFLVAFVPNPVFDIAGVAAGVLNISIWRFIFAVVLGKTLRFILLAYLGLQILGGLI